LNRLEQDYWKGNWNTPLLDYLKTLKPYYKLGIISDAESNARAMVKEWVNEEFFDVIVFSAEEKVCKPHPQIFNIALEKLGVRASSTLFVDDKPKNIEGAKQLGVHAVLYKDLTHLLNILNTYTVEAKA
jgi:HAD superfamily hydrolase (TIGR01509 family)